MSAFTRLVSLLILPVMALTAFGFFRLMIWLNRRGWSAAAGTVDADTIDLAPTVGMGPRRRFKWSDTALVIVGTAPDTVACFFIGRTSKRSALTWFDHASFELLLGTLAAHQGVRPSPAIRTTDDNA